MGVPSPPGRPRLQVALDMTDLRDAVQVAEAVGDEVDILEAGTLLIASAGMEAVRALEAVSGGRQVLADLRIVRAGAALTRLAVDAGADVVVAMGAAPDAVLGAAVSEATRSGAEPATTQATAAPQSCPTTWKRSCPRALAMPSTSPTRFAITYADTSVGRASGE